MMPLQPASTTFLIIPLILNTISAPPQTRAPMANTPEPIVYQLSNQPYEDLDSGPSSNELSWLPPAGICSGHFSIANTTDSSVPLLLLVSLPDQGDGDLLARHPGSNNTKVNVNRVPPWTSLPLEGGTHGVPHLWSEPVQSDRFGLNVSLDVGLFSLSDSSSMLHVPSMSGMNGHQVGIEAPALFGLVLCRGRGNGSFIQTVFQDGRRYRNEVSRYRKRVSAAQPRKLLSGQGYSRNFHRHRRVLVQKTAATMAIGLPLLAVLCAIAGLLLWCTRNDTFEDARSILLADAFCPSGPRRYSHRELAAATGGFPDEGKIGRGGFGPVYRGYLRDQDCHAAIKVLSQASSLQAQGMREFQAEVKVMTRLRHRNIVELLGWSDGPGGLMLVYEFLPNGSLDKHLYDPQRLLTWTERYKIALGVGSAILYLHTECEQCVLHGDIKPANILLDASCNAKLGDFGLARLVDHGADPHTTQVVAGTPGYMDPEFVSNGRPSAEADVFSFGVVLLELACGRRPAAARPNGTPALLNWVRDMYHRSTVLGAADRRLDGEFDHQQMRRVLVAGLWCTHQDQSQRPPIAQAVDLLRRQDADLPVLPEVHSPGLVRSFEEMAYGDLSAEDSVLEDTSSDTAYHTSKDATCLLVEC